MTGIQSQGNGRNKFRKSHNTDGNRCIGQIIYPPANQGTHHTQTHNKNKSADDQASEFRDLQCFERGTAGMITLSCEIKDIKADQGNVK